ncbi:MAG: hypothetical protein K2X62_05795, partial [Beijerinckiaceae bacterium]|nr:hypothetical protein [Beijerinckiaceae bacterium]
MILENKTIRALCIPNAKQAPAPCVIGVRLSSSAKRRPDALERTTENAREAALTAEHEQIACRHIMH